MLFMGIDPGSSSGGMAVMDKAGNLIEIIKMPRGEVDISNFLRNYAGKNQCRARIEKVGARPAQGLVSTCTFCRNHGMLLMALACFKIPFDELTPQRWQSLLSVSPRKKHGGKFVETKPFFKKRLVQMAKRLYPDTKGVNLQTADAILIAESLRREY